jgi:hypothetical protein
VKAGGRFWFLWGSLGIELGSMGSAGSVSEEPNL